MHPDVLPLRFLQQSGALSLADVRLAELAVRLGGEETSAEAALAMALATQWPQRGHTCLDLQTVELEDLWEMENAPLDEPGLAWPERDSWVEALGRCPAIGEPGDKTPFVLWRNRWLYLRRYWDYEREVAERIRAWASVESAPLDVSQLERITARLFKRRRVYRGDLQQLAVLEAPANPCFILTGGPGTGKTTTVIRILALLLELHPDLEIALAAPTGKAALRLQESIALSLPELQSGEAVKARMPGAAQTVHRLLGHQRYQTTFRHDESNPLKHDLVVVDEASMMDVGLLAKLLRALRPETKLLLVGDPHQLPSVDAGAVFGALCSPSSPVPRVELTKNFRFRADSGMGALAEAIRSGDVAGALEALDGEDDDSCRLEPLPAPDRLKEALWAETGEDLRGLQEACEPGEAFDRLDASRVLCAHRTGPYGSLAINELVHDLLVTRLEIPRHQRWFAGKPILITENDYAVELFNGDTGILLPWKGRLHAFFRRTDGGYRHLPPARLPAHEAAYALTVHKSQGSEFDRVILLLTDEPTRILTRELLYTGVTRARGQLRIWSPPSSVKACVERPLRRTSGLPARFESWTHEEQPVS